MLTVMIIDNNIARSKPLADSLESNGFTVATHTEENSISIDEACSALSPDLVIMSTESPCRDTLDHVCMLSLDHEKPIVMFSHDGDSEKIKEATEAGVSAYVVGNIPSERITPVINAAIARFEQTKGLRQKLSEANEKLSERKTIDKAKGILMKQRSLDENEAYKLLRSMAMDKNVKMADISQQLINAAHLLF